MQILAKKFDHQVAVSSEMKQVIPQTRPRTFETAMSNKEGPLLNKFHQNKTDQNLLQLSNEKINNKSSAIFTPNSATLEVKPQHLKDKTFMNKASQEDRSFY